MKNAKYADFRQLNAYFSFNFCRAGSTHRAWQELPRHLRRRAASHRVRRVPLRLRKRSRAEVRSDTLYTNQLIYSSTRRWTHYVEKFSGDRFRSEARKDASSGVTSLRGDRVSTTSQRHLALSHDYMTSGDKKWLETHLWHTKRMHMENIWGYRLVSAYSSAFSVDWNV